MSPASKVVIASHSNRDSISNPLIHNQGDQLYKYDAEKEGGPSSPDATSVHEGEEKFRQLGWVKLTVCLVIGIMYTDVSKASADKTSRLSKPSRLGP